MREAPSALIRFLALFDGEIRAVLPSLGKHIGVNSSKAQKVLGITFIPADKDQSPATVSMTISINIGI
jgi:dihydroflavonol-4-reductase